MDTEGSIEVTCLPWKINRHLRFELLIDEVGRGTLRGGETLNVPIEPGPHTVGITSSGRGTFELDVEVLSKRKVSLACAANSAGLNAAARSRITEVWDGPAPMTLWPIEDDEWPDEPEPIQKRWIANMLLQESLGESPRLVQRWFYRLTIKHYLLWGIFSSVAFGWFLIGELRLNDPSALLALFWSAMDLGSLALLILRTIARRRHPDEHTGIVNLLRRHKSEEREGN